MRAKRHFYSKDDVEFLKANCSLPLQELAKCLHCDPQRVHDKLQRLGLLKVSCREKTDTEPVPKDVVKNYGHTEVDFTLGGHSPCPVWLRITGNPYYSQRAFEIQGRGKDND